MRLLVAEDDPRLLRTLIHIFESNRYSVDGVENGNDALKTQKSPQHDCCGQNGAM